MLLFLKKVSFFHNMMENPRSEEEKIIKDIRNLFKLKNKLKELKI